MDSGDIIFSVTMILISIILLWITSQSMISKKRILVFIPFFVSSIVLAFGSFFSFYGIFTPYIWFLLELPWFLIVGWILLNLWRENE